MRIHPLAILGAAALLASLCAGCLPPKTVILPVGERLTKPDELMAQVRARGERLTSLRASGTILVRKGGQRIKARVLLLSRRPATLRFESESFFDSPMSILVTDGMKFSLWDLQKGRFLVGQATPQNIMQVIPIPMDGPEVAGILLGDPPYIAFADAMVGYDERDGSYLLQLASPREQQEIRFDGALLRPTSITVRKGGKLRYQLTFEDWSADKGGAATPGRIRFEMPDDDIQLDLKLREREPNVPLEDKLFELHPPEGMGVEAIGP